MTTASSKKQSEMGTDLIRSDLAEHLANLLHGLRFRGLTVGPDDAARVVAAFAHSTDWSHARRVRALKALLARSEEERRVIDQLAPMLFVHARHEPEHEELEPRRSSQVGEIPGSRVGTRSALVPHDRFEKDLLASESFWLNRLRWLTAITIIGLLMLGAWRATALWMSGCSWGRPPAPDAGVPEEIKIPGPQDIAPPFETDLPTIRCEPNSPASVLVWPYVLLFGVSTVASFGVGFWRWRAQIQQRNIEILAAAVGPRIYEIEYPGRPAPPLDPVHVREAAFHLSAPTEEAIAPWLDGARTVEASVRQAGRLVLRYGTSREQRSLLLIEDISPTMARWPEHGSQLREAIERQGTDVVHRFCSGPPEELSAHRDLSGLLPLEQELGRLSDPVVVVLSDAHAVTRTAEQGLWLGQLGQAVWFHPRPAELWDEGARWLAGWIRVVPLSEEGLLRLGVPRPDGVEELPRRWHPPRTAVLGIEAHLMGCRAALGDEAFLWMAAGAVLDRVGGLTTRLWWALRSEGVVNAPWERVERVWEMTGVEASVNGAVTLREDLREGLICALTAEHSALLSAVVAWAAQMVVQNLKSIPLGTSAAVAARMTRARLLYIDPTRRREARRELQRLSREGYGAILAASGAQEERQGWGVRLERLRGPGRTMRVAGAVAFAFAILAGTFTLEDGWRERLASRLSPRKPLFRFLTESQANLTVEPGKPLRFCDLNQVGGDRVYMRIEEGPPVELTGRRQENQGPYIFTLSADDKKLQHSPQVGQHKVFLGYGPQATGEFYEIRFLEKASDGATRETSRKLNQGIHDIQNKAIDEIQSLAISKRPAAALKLVRDTLEGVGSLWELDKAQLNLIKGLERQTGPAGINMLDSGLHEKNLRQVERDAWQFLLPYAGKALDQRWKAEVFEPWMVLKAKHRRYSAQDAERVKDVVDFARNVKTFSKQVLAPFYQDGNPRPCVLIGMPAPFNAQLPLSRNSCQIIQKFIMIAEVTDPNKALGNERSASTRSPRNADVIMSSCTGYNARAVQLDDGEKLHTCWINSTRCQHEPSRAQRSSLAVSWGENHSFTVYRSGEDYTEFIRRAGRVEGNRLTFILPAQEAPAQCAGIKVIFELEPPAGGASAIVKPDNAWKEIDLPPSLLQ